MTDTPRAFHRDAWIALCCIVILAVIGGVIWWRISVEDQAAAVAKAAALQPAKIPVTSAKVESADFAVHLNGLGTVEPYQTVVVSSRVDGEITKVAFKQGQMVAKGDVLFVVDPRPYQSALDAANAKKAGDVATLKNANLSLTREIELVGKGVDTRAQLDTQQATVDQLTAQIAADQAQIETAQTQLDYTTIRAPIAGKTGFRLVDVGNIVHATATSGVVTIAKLQPISVVFTAPEEAIGAINTALAAGPVTVIAMSSDGVKVLAQGHLSIVNNTVDALSGTISLKASFANEDNALWPGLSVSTRLLVETLKGVTLIPHGAIQNGPDGLYAFVIGPDAKVAIRAITIGQDSDGRAVVLTGPKPGEVVVTAGQYRLGPGSLVDDTPPAPTVSNPTAKAP
ncbi:efflux RND transporter periplasmic adaptor subunit [Telmatospirillum sp.]|uniref:efflux RND transporter periplasmic adaptor subunit n=1 Tax=Telmatospirillum sp. TaxID=2079197 RepID=UPI00284FDE2B|nr:efflux RND transporter periplasmic adaptor subunit [Telmatospirillum sp.]MDR3439042.1 efflux RND transporter periplasmic adaptor subunit [Telmatospirillum sp.]